MTKLTVLLPIVLLGAFILAIPTLLRAMPDRYVARLPEPLQEIGLPQQQVPILPTANRSDAAQNLLPVGAAPTAMPAPSTPTAVPTQVVAAKQPIDTSEAISSPTPAPSATPSATPWPLPPARRLTGFQHNFQNWNNCGPATLAMALTYFDLHLTQSDTAAVLKPNPEDRNVSPDEMAAYVNDQTPFEAISRTNGNLDLLRKMINSDIPVIIELGINPPGEYRWMGWYGHYLLVVAYDDESQQLWVYDSWFGTSDVPGENAHRDGRVLTYAELDETWPQFNRNYIALYLPEQRPQAQAVIAEAMDDNAMWQAALTQVSNETAEDPENAFLWFNLGTVYNALGRYEDAATAFDQSRAIGLPWRMLWYQFGPYEAYYESGRYDDVVLLADVTLEDRPYFEESFYYRGLALEALGDERGARENLAKAAAFNPNYAPAAEALARLENP